MTVEKIRKAIKPQDFNINIRPNIRKDGKWAGDINVNILVAGDNPLEEKFLTEQVMLLLYLLERKLKGVHNE